ncbi:hypothetical protein N9N28_01855 [Rubripirellula amarantea]|uniref:Uncharacterized protein n=1 Tax=Rubripirellula amarantea TaxID=2527999 RepID=A0A5C5WKP9_9BACT|nr:hypothetical protein [Rubripirellula amarantea]MDA8743352.1 hypothetical protein [Rubripirellula amarantea]TWT51354.1 hypothetical protein Pla22_41310 [Rubripirellula amarantea]
MKILRPAVVMFAMTVSFAVSASSNAAEPAVLHAAPAAVQAPNSLTATYDQLRTDLAKAEFTGDTMLNRIDSFVADVDVALETSPQDADVLGQLRSNALKMRAEVVRFMQDNGTQLVQVNFADVGFPSSGDIVGGPGMSGSPIVGGGSTSSGGMLGGGGGGGAGLGGSGLGRLGLLGAAVGIPVGIATSDDDDSPGVIASPSF